MNADADRPAPMTNDERKALIADATALANWHCSDCDLVTSPYALIEVRIAGEPVRWLCWTCLHELFGSEDSEQKDT